MEVTTTRTIRIRTLLLLGISTIIVLMAGVSVLLLWQQSQMESGCRSLHQVNTLERYLLECRRQEKNFLLRHQRANIDLFRTNLDSLVAATTHLAGDARDDTALPELELLLAREREYASAFSALVAWSAGQEQERLSLVDHTVTSARTCHALMNEIRETTIARLRAANSTARAVNVATVVLGLLLALMVSGWLTRRIVRPLEYLRQRTDSISAGDIQDIDIEFSELEVARLANRETRELGHAFQRMVSSLRLAVSSEVGTMDNYHMAIVVLVNLALGPSGRAVIERARARAGFRSFAEIRPAEIEAFLAALREESGDLVSEQRYALLSDAILRLEV
jgi:methyl-accepting chemotaxis protein